MSQLVAEETGDVVDCRYKNISHNSTSFRVSISNFIYINYKIFGAIIFKEHKIAT